MTLSELPTLLATTVRLDLGFPSEALIRLLLAGVCGGLVGLEREIRGRQAGFRTNILVCVGSSLVMIVSICLAMQPWTSHNVSGVNINVDPGRIPYGVMGGIGFLGAGTIIHNKGSIRGLTTAAALWCVAAIGLAAGLGLYNITIAATVIIVLVLWLLNYIERAVPQMRYRSITVRVPWREGCIKHTIDHIKTRGFRVMDASFDRSKDERFALIDLHIGFLKTNRYYNLERELEAGGHDIELIATRQVQH